MSHTFNSKADTRKELSDNIEVLTVRLENMETPHINDPDFEDQMNEQNNLRFKIRLTKDKRENLRHGRKMHGEWIGQRPVVTGSTSRYLK